MRRGLRHCARRRKSAVTTFKGARRRLVCEPLEARQLLAVITVPGTAGDDRLEIVFNSNSSLSYYTGGSSTPTNVSLTEDVDFRFDADGGTDRVVVLGSGSQNARILGSETAGTNTISVAAARQVRVLYSGLEDAAIGRMASSVLYFENVFDGIATRATVRESQVTTTYVSASYDAISVASARETVSFWSTDLVNVWNGDSDEIAVFTVVGAANNHGITNLTLNPGIVLANTVDVQGPVKLPGRLTIEAGLVDQSSTAPPIEAEEINLSVNAVQPSSGFLRTKVEVIGVTARLGNIYIEESDGALVDPLSGYMAAHIKNLAGELQLDNVFMPTLTLDSAGGARHTGTAYVTKLELLGGGPYTLSLPYLDTLAANTNGPITISSSGSYSVGRVNGTSGITTLDNDVLLQWTGALTIDRAINVGAGALTLEGRVSQQSGAIRAGGLLLLDAERAQLLNADNDVDTLAASVKGSIEYFDRDGLTIGQLGAYSGVRNERGAIDIAVGDTALPGDDLVLAAGAAITNGSTPEVAGGVRLAAGDAVRLLDLSTLSTAGPVVIDVGHRDVDGQGAGELRGAIVSPERVRVNGGLAGDVLTVGQMPASGLLFTGAGGNDELRVLGDDRTWTITGTNAGTTANAEFQNVENLTGGSARDVFAFSDAAALTGAVDGGGGSDTLDYRLYTTPVAALLPESGDGTATGLAAHRRMENFVGGLGNDVVQVQPLIDATRTIKGGPHGANPPGDALYVDAGGRTVSFEPGVVHTLGRGDVYYDTIETFRVEGGVQFRDLGAVDYRELRGLDATDGRWYRVEATLDGILTAVATPQDGGQAILSLYDEPGGTTPLVSGSGRIDWPVQAGKTYYLRLSGTSEDVTLQVVNMVHYSSGNVVINGTPADDTLDFNAGQRRLAVNGVTYGLEDIQRVVFVGAGGNDIARLAGSPQDDQAAISPFSVSLISAGLTLSAIDTERIFVDLLGGSGDAVTMYDSAGADSVVVSPERLTLSGEGGAFFNEVVNYDNGGVRSSRSGAADRAVFEEGPGVDRLVLTPAASSIKYEDGRTVAAEGIEFVSSTASPDKPNTAIFQDSPADDVFTGRAESSELTGNGYRLLATGYRQVYVYTSAGFDTANLFDGAGQDQLVLRSPNTADAGSGEVRYASGSEIVLRTASASNTEFFDRVLATSSDPGIDLAWLYDSPGNDRYVGQAGAPLLRMAQLSGVYRLNAYSFLTTGFGYVYVEPGAGSAGFDTALLVGSPAADRYTATPGGAALRYANRDLQSLKPFERVDVQGNGGPDQGQLFDTPQDDLLVVRPDRTELRSGAGDYEHRLEGFANVSVYASAGGTDEARLFDGPGNDRAVLGSDSYLAYGNGRTAWTRGFERVEAAASAGNDSAVLYDTAASDIYTAFAGGRDEAVMAPQAGDAYRRAATGFDRYDAFSTAGGVDEARLYDSPANDLLVARPQEVRLSHATTGGVELRAYQFEQVVTHAVAASGDLDTAWLYDDAASSDAFEGQWGRASMRRATTGSWTYANVALGFDTVYGVATADAGPYDTATLIDTALPDVVRTYGVFNEGYIQYGGVAEQMTDVRGFDFVLFRMTGGGADRVAMIDSAQSDLFTGADDWGQMVDDQWRYRHRVEGLGSADSLVIVSQYGSPAGRPDRDRHLATIDYLFGRSGPWT